MKNDWKFQRNQRRDDDQKKLLGAMVIPLIVIVLILVIVVADRCGRKEPDEESTEAVTTVGDTMSSTAAPETESSEDSGEGETEPAETADPFEEENFERDSIPEILDLMKRYFSARATADAVAMNQLYGIGEEDVSVVELEAQKTRMRSNSKYVSGFENIVTYVKPGTTSDTWLVYTIAEIQFRSVKNRAPMIMWCYVKKDAEGNYLLVDNRNLPTEVLNYVDEAGRSEAVRRLAADVNTRLKTALEEDSDLQQVYGILNSDSPLWVDEDPNTDPDLVILDDETSVAEPLETSSESPSETPGETVEPEA